MNARRNITESIAINEVEMLLSEKRTALSVLRTGIAVLALPLSAMSLLVATSRYYDILNVLHFFVPVVILSIGLTIFGIYLIIRSIILMRHYDKHINAIKEKHSLIGRFIE